MKQNTILLGVQSPGDELEIRDIQRIKRVEEAAIGLFDGTAGPVLRENREVLLNAWSGKTVGDHPVHMAYRCGELSIQVDLPTPGGGRWALTVLRWKPRRALGQITHVPVRSGENGKSLRDEFVRLEEASAELAEIRAINGKPRILSEGEMRHWLVERNRYFMILSNLGLAGGKLRILLP